MTTKSPSAPRFELRNVYDDGSEGEPLILPVAAIGDLPADMRAGRRGFLGAGISAASLLLLLGDQCAAARPGRAAAGAAPTTPPGAKGKPASPAKRAAAARVLAKGLRAHAEPVNALAVTANGKYLASASDDETVKLWTLPEGRYLTALRGHRGEVTSLAARLADDLLCSGSADGTVNVWSVSKGGMLLRTLDARAAVTALAVASGGKLLACRGEDGTVGVASLPDGTWQRDIPAGSKGGAQGTLTCRYAESLLATGSADGIRLWSAANGAARGELPGHTGVVSALAASARGNHLASVSDDGAIRVFSLSPRKLLRTLRAGPGESVTAVALSPDGLLLASGSTDRLIRLWSLPACKPLAVLRGHAEHVTALAFTSNGKLLASADYDGTILLWDVVTGSLRTHLADPKACEPQAKAVTYRTRDVGLGRTLVFTLPCGAPVPAGATCICNCVPGTALRTPQELAAERRYVISGERTRLEEEAREERKAEAQARAEEREAEELARAEERAEAREQRRQRESQRGGRRRGGGMGGGGSVCTCVPVCVCLAVPVCQAHRLLHPDPLVRRMAEQLLLWMGRRELHYMRWAAGSAAWPALERRIRGVIRAVLRGAAPDLSAWPDAGACAGYLGDADEVVAIMAAQVMARRACEPGSAAGSGTRRRVARLLAAAARRPWYVRAAIRDHGPGE